MELDKVYFDVVQEYEYRGFNYSLLVTKTGVLFFLMGAKYFPADDIYALCRVEEYIDGLCN